MLYNKIKSSFYCLLVVGILLRALLPTGFMPNLEAAQQGLLKITICAAQGSQEIFVDSHMQQQKPKAQSHKFCDFSLNPLLALFFTLSFLSSLIFWTTKNLSFIPHLLYTNSRYISAYTARGPPAA